MDDQRALESQPSRTKPISAGIRVLVVDDDSTCLKIVEVMLRSFQYEVVAVENAIDALAILRERQGGFDIVLTDLHMPGMDGIALLERVEVEFKIPVVIMSIDDEEVVASRCLESGASCYLTKPLTGSDLSSLWQYVYLKKLDETMVIEQIESDSELPTPKKVSKEDTDCGSFVNESNWRQESRKESSTKNNQNEGKNKDGNLTQKKSRVAWNKRLHNKFLDAIDQIGLHRVAPIKILEVMNIPGLTRENVASHLQKYRIFLKRMKEASRFGGPGIIRSLMENGALKSKSALGHPSQLLSLEKEFFRISDHRHCAHKSFEPRLKKCSASQLGDENSILKRNHKKLKKPSLDIISSVNQQNDGTYSFQILESSNIRAGSSLYGGTPTSLASNTDTFPTIHLQPQAKIRHFAQGSLDHSFNIASLPSDNVQSVGSMRSFNNHNQASNFSYTNNGFADIQMNSIEKLSEFNKMPIGHGPSNGTSCGYNRMDEIRNGKMPLVDSRKSPLNPGFTSSHSDYVAEELASYIDLMPQGLAPPGGLAPQGSISSSGFPSTNPFLTTLTNVSQQLDLLPPPPPPQHQQDDIEVREEVASIFKLMENNSPTPSFHEDYINDMLFKSVDQSPNQQEVYEEVMDPEFNINDCLVDSDNPSLWIHP